LARSEVPVKQITTGTLCHLEAAMVEHALEDWNLGQLDVLFVENVGNLVCPASYDLGEDLRLVLLSVTEGPTIFNSADAGVITKIDLAAAVEFDELAANANIQAVRPGMRVFKVSAKLTRAWTTVCNSLRKWWPNVCNRHLCRRWRVEMHPSKRMKLASKLMG
jgi:hydrogenase nickel incorporation protein HypB